MPQGADAHERVSARTSDATPPPRFRKRGRGGFIDGETVVVSAKGVTKPTAVRYGCFTAMRGQTHLYNREGLPAVEFATDDSPDPMPFKHLMK